MHLCVWVWANVLSIPSIHVYRWMAVVVIGTKSSYFMHTSNRNADDRIHRWPAFCLLFFSLFSIYGMICLWSFLSHTDARVCVYVWAMHEIGIWQFHRSYDKWKKKSDSATHICMFVYIVCWTVESRREMLMMFALVCVYGKYSIQVFVSLSHLRLHLLSVRFGSDRRSPHRMDVCIRSLIYTSCHWIHMIGMHTHTSTLIHWRKNRPFVLLLLLPVVVSSFVCVCLCVYFHI